MPDSETGEVKKIIKNLKNFTGEFLHWGIDVNRSRIQDRFKDQYITTCAMWRKLEAYDPNSADKVLNLVKD